MQKPDFALLNFPWRLTGRLRHRAAFAKRRWPHPCHAGISSRRFGLTLRCSDSDDGCSFRTQILLDSTSQNRLSRAFPRVRLRCALRTTPVKSEGFSPKLSEGCLHAPTASPHWSRLRPTNRPSGSLSVGSGIEAITLVRFV